LANTVDRSFESTIKLDGFSIICDIPSIQSEYQVLKNAEQFGIKKDNIDFHLNNRMLLYMKHIFVSNTNLNINNLSYSEKLQIIQKIPAKLTKLVAEGYLDKIEELANNVSIIKLKCNGKIGKDSCDDTLEKNFNVYTINDTLRLLYKDNSNEGILRDYFTLGMNAHIASLLPNMIPKDIITLMQFNKSLNKSDRKDEEMPHTDNIFEEYRKQTAGMKETPSQFGI
jgi:hypothetical protein